MARNYLFFKQEVFMLGPVRSDSTDWVSYVKTTFCCQSRYNERDDIDIEERTYAAALDSLEVGMASEATVQVINEQIDNMPQACLSSAILSLAAFTCMTVSNPCVKIASIALGVLGAYVCYKPIDLPRGRYDPLR